MPDLKHKHGLPSHLIEAFTSDINAKHTRLYQSCPDIQNVSPQCSSLHRALVRELCRTPLRSRTFSIAESNPI